MSNTPPTNADDIIDSRDILDRIVDLRESLQAEIEECRKQFDQLRDRDDLTAEDAYPFESADSARALDDGLMVAVDAGHVDSDDLGELAALLAVAIDGRRSPDWTYGEPMIRDSYFRDFVQQLAEDIGAVDPNANWPLTCLDWDAAAEELKQDYFELDFDGVTYWIRA